MHCLQQDFYKLSGIFCSLEKKEEKKSYSHVSVVAGVSSVLHGWK